MNLEMEWFLIADCWEQQKSLKRRDVFTLEKNLHI